MSLPPVLSHYLQAIRRSTARMRPGHVAALCVVAAAGLGLAGLRAVDLPGPRPITDGERMRIELVPPVEPQLVAGSRMEVGDLVDGFQGVPPPLPSLTEVSWSDDEGPAYADEAYPSPIPADHRRADSRTWDSRPEREPRRDTPARIVGRWFGFDEPRRDFQAERAARRARLEAMEQAAYERRAYESQARERQARERHDRERRRYERAEQDRYAAERRAGAEPPRWRDGRYLDQPRDDDWRGEDLPADEQGLPWGTAAQPGPRPYSLADEVG